MNQGMLMESLNLAACWRLPVLFVCKDNGMAITTPSRRVTAGNLPDRVRGFGIPAAEVDGADVEAVWQAAGRDRSCGRAVAAARVISTPRASDRRGTSSGTRCSGSCAGRWGSSRTRSGPLVRGGGEHRWGRDRRAGGEPARHHRHDRPGGRHARPGSGGPAAMPGCTTEAAELEAVERAGGGGGPGRGRHRAGEPRGGAGMRELTFGRGDRGRAGPGDGRRRAGGGASARTARGCG